MIDSVADVTNINVDATDNATNDDMMIQYMPVIHVMKSDNDTDTNIINMDAFDE